MLTAAHIFSVTAVGGGSRSMRGEGEGEGAEQGQGRLHGWVVEGLSVRGFKCESREIKQVCFYSV